MPIHIDAQVCKGCGLCVYYCPRDVLRLSEKINVRGYTVAEVVHYENCTHCRLCELSCPDLAIFVEKPEKETETSAAAPD
jgi:2-oxoglutarate ferredoxin oxidoreductase subunit delta